MAPLLGVIFIFSYFIYHIHTIFRTPCSVHTLKMHFLSKANFWVSVFVIDRKTYVFQEHKKVCEFCVDNRLKSEKSGRNSRFHNFFGQIEKVYFLFHRQVQSEFFRCACRWSFRDFQPRARGSLNYFVVLLVTLVIIHIPLSNMFQLYIT